ncbi:hypothetical protein PROFUN_10357 [Planoprotostelium fungivorum]|uniref:Uncharacterized protein n=1 Tax=Planoprotostelium fungivorum TaxID=1890364 RepID=A0A2P6NDW3_9EUKA|nr:hypothetical protein PROFUN_10357 [Planoprotostelium fungivorum]
MVDRLYHLNRLIPSVLCVTIGSAAFCTSPRLHEAIHILRSNPNFGQTYTNDISRITRPMVIKPDPVSFFIGSVIMLVGVILPLSVMILKNKKVKHMIMYDMAIQISQVFAKQKS